MSAARSCTVHPRFVLHTVPFILYSSSHCRFGTHFTPHFTIPGMHPRFVLHTVLFPLSIPPLTLRVGKYCTPDCNMYPPRLPTHSAGLGNRCNYCTPLCYSFSTPPVFLTHVYSVFHIVLCILIRTPHCPMPTITSNMSPLFLVLVPAYTAGLDSYSTLSYSSSILPPSSRTHTAGLGNRSTTVEAGQYTVEYDRGCIVQCRAQCSEPVPKTCSVSKETGRRCSLTQTRKATPRQRQELG